jgi:tetratricopeptide (TPR) repeat protein
LAAQIARQVIVHLRTAESQRPLPATVEAGHYILQARSLHENERGPQSTREAQALFSKALSLEADSVSGLQGYATTKLLQVHNGWIPFEKRPAAIAEADEAIERLIRLDPRNAVGHYLRASLLRARGEPDKAIASLNYSLSLNSSFFATHAELGRIKIDAGNAHDAIKHLDEALELTAPETNVHVLYFWMGLAALHMADDEAAVQHLLKALQINPRFSASHLLLAAAYLGVGEEAKARASMAEFLKTVPNFSIAGMQRLVPTPTQVATQQRVRMHDAWRRLGAPENKTVDASR